MSEGNGSGHFEEFGLFIIAAVIVGGGILYCLYLFWPDFVFYVLPLAIGSLIIGGILRLVTMPGEGSRGFIHYWGLNVIYPILILAVAVVFFAGEERAILLDKKGQHIIGTHLDWPGLNKTFNEWRSSTYEGSPFKSLQAAAKENVVYDRQELGWVMLWCLFLGGPLFFWYLARQDDAKNEEVLEGFATERTDEKRKMLDERTAKLNEIIESNAANLTQKITELKAERERILKENQILKAKVEFSPDIPRPPESVKTGGVLDKDIL